MFTFEVKFYPTEPVAMHEDLTRYARLCRLIHLNCGLVYLFHLFYVLFCSSEQYSGILR